jgi:hypothetical protein
VKARRSRSSPVALLPPEFATPPAPLLPHIRSSRTRLRIRTSTSSKSCSEFRRNCEVFRLSSRHKRDAAARMRSRCSGLDVVAIEEEDAFRTRRPGWCAAGIGLGVVPRGEAAREVLGESLR